MDSDLCAHGCMRLPSVEHADGRALCRSCYDAEVGGHPFLPCPVCDPREQFAPVAYWTDAVLVEKVAQGLYATGLRISRAPMPPWSHKRQDERDWWLGGVGRGGVPVSAYEQGRRRYEMWRIYGGNREGVFLTGLNALSTDEQRADYEDGWIAASDEDDQ